MARSGQLTARRVEELSRARVPGHWGDGGGLTLQISRWGTPSWTFRYRVDGRLREAGIGSLDSLSLEQARKRARAMREQRLDGTDPIEQRRARKLAARIETAKAMTFRQCAEAYIRAHEAGWRSPKSLIAWQNTLGGFAYPIIGELPISAIETGLVMRVLEQPIDAEGTLWSSRPETASRLRGRIEAVLDYARVRGWRDASDNPARWRGHIDMLLPAPTSAKRTQRQATGRGEHLAALPYARVGEFMTALREQEGAAAGALEFAILTAARTGEVRGATWREFDIAERGWVVPAGRMKGGREHRVPLSDRALAILGEAGAPDEFVFHTGKANRPLSNMAMLMLLRRMGRADITAHGFRSTFRDWAAERSGFPAEVAELALSHTVGSAVERAYRRSDMFQKRRQLADAWARYCMEPQGGAAGRVVPLRGRA